MMVPAISPLVVRLRSWVKQRGISKGLHSRPSQHCLEEVAYGMHTYQLSCCHPLLQCLQALDLDNEAVLFVCTGLAVNVAPPTIPGVEAGAGTSDTGLAAAGSDPSYTQAFSLSSRPSAVKKMYLDFTGYTLTGT